MKNLLSRHFTKLELKDGFYNIGIHPVMNNVLTVTLSDVAGYVSIPANRWAMDIYTDKLSAIVTSADKHGVYFSYYSLSCNSAGEHRTYSLYATWEDLGIHRSAVGKAFLDDYKLLFRDYILSRFFKYILSLGSSARQVALRWIHDVHRGDHMWSVGKFHKVIRQGELYNVYHNGHRKAALIEPERLVSRMFQ